MSVPIAAQREKDEQQPELNQRVPLTSSSSWKCLWPVRMIFE